MREFFLSKEWHFLKGIWRREQKALVQALAMMDPSKDPTEMARKQGRLYVLNAFFTEDDEMTCHFERSIYEQLKKKESGTKP